MALSPPSITTLKQYGIDTLDWLKQMAHQRDRCYICHRSFTKKRRPQNDHRHSDGLYRGLLCEHCNTSLGMLHDDWEWCLRAYWYLTHPPALEALDGPRYAKDAPPRRGAHPILIIEDEVAL